MKEFNEIFKFQTVLDIQKWATADSHKKNIASSQRLPATSKYLLKYVLFVLESNII